MHRYGDRPLLHEDLAATYDAFETPRSARGDIELLDRRGALEYLDEVRARTLEVIAERGIGDGTLFELVIRHEHQHRETMLQTLQLARLEGFAPAAPPDPRGPGGLTGLEPIEIPAGAAAIGAAAEGFAYDNERPRHMVSLPAFRIGRTPVTNATWRHFAEGGGYERRTLWSDEAWSWKEQYDITHPLHWSDDGHEWRMGKWVPLDPDKPVVHVSWFEADAFARAQGARLPTEFEWERAATWDQRTQSVRAPSRPPRQPRPARVRHAAGRRLPGGREPERRPGHARRRLGVDVQRLPRLPRLPPAPLPRVLRGLLRPRLQGPAWRLVGDRAPRGHARPSATGTCPSGARSSPACAWPGTREHGDHPRQRPDPDRLVAHRGRRAHARRRRARRADQAVQGAAAEALLRHARLGAVRPDLRAARVLPDAHRAGDPRDPRRRHRRGGADRGAARARLRLRARRPACSWTRWPRRARCAATCPSTWPSRSCARPPRT